MKHDITYVDEGYGHESASCSCGEKWGSMDRGLLVAETALHKCDAEAEGLKKLEAEVERLRLDNADLLARLDAAAFAVQQGLCAVAEKQREADRKAFAAWLREVHATGLPHETPEVLADAVDAGEAASPLVTEGDK